MSGNEISPIFISAHLWQSRGWGVIPAQPNSKRLVRGFGIYANHVEDGGDVNFWFQDRRVNLAVVAPLDGGVILDFDQLELYKQFTDRWPELAASYTEFTPRGGRHVFLQSTEILPRGLQLVLGIEVKQICLVYPSWVNGRPYGVAVPGEIRTGDVLEALKPFLKPEWDNPPRPEPGLSLAKPEGTQRVNFGDPGILEDIKARWPILEYLEHFESGLKLSGSGRWRSGLCPWHPDKHPSLWVDIERNLWGCHSCEARGDVINWHARRLETLNQANAARDLARYKFEVLHV